MKSIVSILLVAAGIALIVLGSRRSDSIAGVIDETAKDVANSVDGGTRVSDHVWYYVGGGVLILAGGTALLRKKAP